MKLTKRHASALLLGAVVFCTSTSGAYVRRRKLLGLDSDSDDNVGGGFSLLTAVDGPHCSAHLPHPIALIVWVAGILYCFLAIAIVCDDFFVPSLEEISRVLQLSDDVAGATFMAAGSSAPELFTSLAGVFFVKDVKQENVGPGTIVGSAVFNIAIIIGASVVCVGNTLDLDWWPLLRDGSYYTISIMLLIASFAWITPGQVDWWEALIFLAFYGGYCYLMKMNQHILARINHDHNPHVELEDATAPPPPTAEGLGGASARVLRGSSLQKRYENRVHVSQLVEAASRPRGQSSSVAGAGSGAGAGSSGGGAGGDEEGSLAQSRDRPSFRSIGLTVIAIQRLQHAAQTAPVHDEPVPDADVAGAAASTVAMAATEEEEPPTRIGRVIATLSIPILFVFRHTIPDVSQDRNKKYYLLAFFLCIFWIAVVSYFMVEFALKLGLCLHLSPNVMGLTVLAAGTSVPDALCSINVAKNGQGNMAISNAIGSNVFDILLGLGLPWFLSSACVRRVPLPVETTGIVAFTVMLFMVLLIFLALVRFSQWKLKVWHGYALFGVYVVYAVLSIMIDKGVFRV